MSLPCPELAYVSSNPPSKAQLGLAVSLLVLFFCGNKCTQTLIIYICSEVAIRRNQHFPIYIKIAINLWSGNE